MENLLEIAESKFIKSKEGATNFSKDFQTFLIECYIHLTPASYGYQIQNRVLEHLNKIEPVSSKKNCADFSIGNWKLLLSNVYLNRAVTYFLENQSEMSTIWVARFYSCFTKILEVFNEKYYFNCEVKVSYLNKNGLYTLRNLRPYQNYSHYLIIFIDCENSFSYNMSLVEKEVIYKTLRLSDMHGIKEVNVNVTNKHLGGIVKKRSYEEAIIFDDYNLLKSNSFKAINDVIDNILQPAEEEISKISLEDILEICPDFQTIFYKVIRG